MEKRPEGSHQGRFRAQGAYPRPKKTCRFRIVRVTACLAATAIVELVLWA
jgi:hypothetical protein